MKTSLIQSFVWSLCCSFVSPTRVEADGATLLAPFLLREDGTYKLPVTIKVPVVTHEVKPDSSPSVLEHPQEREFINRITIRDSGAFVQLHFSELDVVGGWADYKQVPLCPGINDIKKLRTRNDCFAMLGKPYAGGSEEEVLPWGFFCLDQGLLRIVGIRAEFAVDTKKIRSLRIISGQVNISAERSPLAPAHRPEDKQAPVPGSKLPHR